MRRPVLKTAASTAGRAALALSEVEGGQITLYGVAMLQGNRPLFIVEAELDALLLWQVAGDEVEVVALAGAGRTLPSRWLARLLPYPRIFAALDTDNAGMLNTTRLAALSARITPVRVPKGNDVTEYITGPVAMCGRGCRW